MEEARASQTFNGQWMTHDGDAVTIKDSKVIGPDSIAADLDIKSRDTVHFTVLGSTCEGKLSFDGDWLVWDDGTAWARMPGDEDEDLAEVKDAEEEQELRDVEDSEEEGQEPRTSREVEAPASARLAEEEGSAREDQEMWDVEDSENEVQVPGTREAAEASVTVAPVAQKAQEERRAQEAHVANQPALEERLEKEALEAEQKAQEERQVREATAAEQAALKKLEAEQKAQEERQAREVAAADQVALNKRLEKEAVEALQKAQQERQAREAAEAAVAAQKLEEERQVREAVAAAQKALDERLAQEAAEAAREDQERQARKAAEAAAASQKIEEELVSEFEKVVDDSNVDALEQPSPDKMPDIYTQPLQYVVKMKGRMPVRQAPSTMSPVIYTILCGKKVKGFQQGGWLKLQEPEKGWLLIDGSKRGAGQLLEHGYLQPRILRTFEDGALLEWDMLRSAKFVEYCVQWERKDEPGRVTTAAAHLPKTAARLEGLPAKETVLIRVCACIYTGTESSGGLRFATVKGAWHETKLADEPHVDCLEQPTPENMEDVYTAPLQYVVLHPKVIMRQAASTRANCLGVLAKGEPVLGYQQGNWLFVQKAVKGWVLIDGSKLGHGQLLGHKYLQLRLSRVFSEAARVEWDSLPGAKYVDYRLEWAQTSEPSVVHPSTDRIPRTRGVARGLPADSEVMIRVCACIYTGTKANGGYHFATVVGQWLDVETGMTITTLDEENLCLDPMAHLRGRCMDCDCRGFVLAEQSHEHMMRDTMNEVVCRRCGCACTRHVIIGEYSHRRVKGQTPSAFKLPARILHEAEREAREAQQAHAALTDGTAQALPPLGLELTTGQSWRPEDSGMNEDRVKFVLDKIAQAHTLYETLGVLPTCSDKDIRHAHRRISLHVHPDKVLNRNEPDLVKQAEAAFKIVSAAYEILGDEVKRASYNHTIRAKSSTAFVRSNGSTRKDLTAATLLTRFLSKSMWGWDLSSKPPGEWEEYGKGVYGRATNNRVLVVHAITKEELVINLPKDSSTSLPRLKELIVEEVKRGPISAIGLVSADGEELQDDYWFQSSQTIVVAGISSLGPPKDVKLCLSHAHTGARLYLTVPDTSTIAEVQKAAAESLEKPQWQIRLGFRWNNDDTFRAFLDKERLNGRTHILILGVDITVNLSVEEATELQVELVEAYGSEMFQTKLDILTARHPPPEGLLDPDFKCQWSDLLKGAQKNILLKNGFDGPLGAFTMIRAFENVNHDPEVQRLGALIDKKLRVTMGTVLPPLITVDVEPALVGASQGEQAASLKVVVVAFASARQLREAIAAKLGVEVDGVLVGQAETKEEGSPFVPLEDSASLGGQKRFKVLGVDLPAPGELRRRAEEQRQENYRRAAEMEKELEEKKQADAVELSLQICGQCSRRRRESVYGSGDHGIWYCNLCWADFLTKDGKMVQAKRARDAEAAEAKEVAPAKASSEGAAPAPRPAYVQEPKTSAPERKKPEPEPKKAAERPKKPAEEPRKPEAKPQEPQPPKPAPAPRLTQTTSPPEPASTKERQELTLALANPKAQPTPVRLEVSHVCREQRVSLQLTDKTTWLEALRALARRVARPQVLQHGKLVSQHEDGSYSSFPGHQAIGQTDKAILMNADLSFSSNIADVMDADYKEAERLRRTPGSAPPPPQVKPRPKEALEATLRVQKLHSVGSIDIVVLRSATSSDVKEAMAFATGRPIEEFCRDGVKLLKRDQYDGGFTSVKDGEVVGAKQNLWFMNAEIEPLPRSPADAHRQRGTPLVTPAVLEAQAAEESPLPAGGMLALQDGAYLEEASDANFGPEPVLVTISHSMNTADFKEVTVQDDCAFDDVLEALAVRLGQPEVKTKGRFVEKKGTTSFKALRAQDPLGDRRDLLYMGTSFPKTKR